MESPQRETTPNGFTPIGALGDSIAPYIMCSDCVEEDDHHDIIGIQRDTDVRPHTARSNTLAHGRRASPRKPVTTVSNQLQRGHHSAVSGPASVFIGFGDADMAQRDPIAWSDQSPSVSSRHSSLAQQVEPARTMSSPQCSLRPDPTPKRSATSPIGCKSPSFGHVPSLIHDERAPSTVSSEPELMRSHSLASQSSIISNPTKRWNGGRFHPFSITRQKITREMIEFGEGLEKLVHLIDTAVRELPDDKLETLQTELRHDWRVYEMATFVEGYFKGASERGIEW